MTNRAPYRPGRLLEADDVLRLLPPELEAEARLADGRSSDLGLRLRSSGRRLLADVVRTKTGSDEGRYFLDVEVLAEEVLVWDARTDEDLVRLADDVSEAAQEAGLSVQTDEERFRKADPWEWLLR